MPSPKGDPSVWQGTGSWEVRSEQEQAYKAQSPSPALWLHLVRGPQLPKAALSDGIKRFRHSSLRGHVTLIYSHFVESETFPHGGKREAYDF